MTPRETRAAEEAARIEDYRRAQEIEKFIAMLDEHLPGALARMENEEKKP